MYARSPEKRESVGNINTSPQNRKLWNIEVRILPIIISSLVNILKEIACKLMQNELEFRVRIDNPCYIVIGGLLGYGEKWKMFEKTYCKSIFSDPPNF